MANNDFMHRQTVDNLTDELRVLIFSVRDLEIHADQENLNGELVKAAFTEIYPPTSLFTSAIRTLPAIYSALRT